MCVNFQSKWTALNFLAKISPKIDLGLKIEKINVRIRVSILEILCVPIFSQNGQLSLFRPKFAQQWILVLKFQKSKAGFGIYFSKIPRVPIFSQNGQLFLFRSMFR